jgi:hypothetical protein
MEETDLEILLEMLRDRTFVEDYRQAVEELAMAFALLDYIADAAGPDFPLLLRARDGQVLASRNLHPRHRQAESCTVYAGYWYSLVVLVKKKIASLEELLAV